MAVSVAVRIRPILAGEQVDNIVVTQTESEEVCVNRTRVYQVDRVHGQSDSTETIYEQSVHPLAEAFLDGFNGTVMAYGQTGAGKTYTMDGLAPRLLSTIFAATPIENLTFSYVEVYGETIHDLLLMPKDTPRPRPLQLVDDPGWLGTHVAGATRVRIKAEQEALWLLEHGSKTRIAAATKMNAVSSRSHSIFTVMDSKRMAKLHIVDLAGSERNKKTLNRGVRFKESININSGLLALGNVIRALTREPPAAHVPYRASKLTRLLSDALGGNSKTLFIACVSAGAENLDETTRTLQYACRTMSIVNEPVPNLDKIIAAQQRELMRVKSELDTSKSSAHRDPHATDLTAEIRTLTDTVEELQRELSEAKTTLKKDEIIFTQNLRNQRKLEAENKDLKQEVAELRRLLAKFEVISPPPPQQEHREHPRDQSPGTLYVPQNERSPGSPLHAQTEFLATNYANRDQVLCTNTPPRSILSASSDDRLREALEENLYYQQYSKELKGTVEHLAEENEDLKVYTTSLEDELHKINSLLQ